jgi:hypothetical protein
MATPIITTPVGNGGLFGGGALGYYSGGSSGGSSSSPEENAATIAWEREQSAAQTAMDFTAQQNAAAMAFSASEAERNREYQTSMSNTAYQRAVADLQASGLNPALAAGSSASTPVGDSGQGYSGSGVKANATKANEAGYLTAVSGLISSILGPFTSVLKAVK